MTDEFNNEIEIEELSESISNYFKLEAKTITKLSILCEEALGRKNGLAFYIYANDHQPPHFHVRGFDIDATFRIDNGQIINGNIKNTHNKLINNFYNANKSYIKQVSNKYYRK